MVSGKVTIVNRLGLHARAATKFLQIAKAYACTVQIGHPEDSKLANGKSIMSLLTLVADTGTVLELQTEGPHEAEAFRVLSDLIANRFGEAD